MRPRLGVAASAVLLTSTVLVALGSAVTHACHAAGDIPTGPRPAVVAGDIMRSAAARVTPGDNLARAADVMESLGSREVPVVTGRTLVGILTRTDMEPHRGHYEWTPVLAAMTPNPRRYERNPGSKVLARRIPIIMAGMPSAELP